MANISRKTRRCPTDLTDQEWERIKPLVRDPAQLDGIAGFLRSCGVEEA